MANLEQTSRLGKGQPLSKAVGQLATRKLHPNAVTPKKKRPKPKGTIIGGPFAGRA